jgi:predicted transcriptional regulator
MNRSETTSKSRRARDLELLNEAFNRFRDVGLKRRLMLRDSDLNIMEAFHAKGKMNQYKLEQTLSKDSKSLSHSTTTEKLNRLVRLGLVEKNKEDKLMFYNLTLFGAGCLLFGKRVNVQEFLRNIQKNMKNYLELLSELEPSFRKLQESEFPSFTVQLTDDLQAVFALPDSVQIKKQTIDRILAPRNERSTPNEQTPNFNVRLICLNRRKFNEKWICVRNAGTRECVYESRGFAQCEVLQAQMQRELERLEDQLKKKR